MITPITIAGKKAGQPDIDIFQTHDFDIAVMMLPRLQEKYKDSDEFDEVNFRDMNEEEAAAENAALMETSRQAQEALDGISKSLAEKRAAGTPEAEAEAAEIIGQLENIADITDSALEAAGRK